MITPARVRELFLDVWKAQSCQNPDHWDRPADPGQPPAPEVLKALLAPNDSVRTSYRWRVENAVSELVGAYAEGVPTDASMLVWRLFPHFDKSSCRQLADRLAAEVDETRTTRTRRRVAVST
jgi:hypothetical protein